MAGGCIIPKVFDRKGGPFKAQRLRGQSKKTKTKTKQKQTKTQRGSEVLRNPMVAVTKCRS